MIAMVGNGVGPRATFLAYEEPAKARLAARIPAPVRCLHREYRVCPGDPRNSTASRFSRRRITAAPKGLKRKTRQGPLGNRASTASPQTSWIGARARPAACQICRLRCAIFARIGFSSIPMTLRNGYSAASSMARPIPAPTSMNVKLSDRGGWLGPSPALQKCMKYRRRDAEIRGGMAVVGVACLQIAPGNQPAGLDAILQIEWVLGESIFLRHAWQRNPCRTQFLFPLSRRSRLNLSTSCRALRASVLSSDREASSAAG